MRFSLGHIGKIIKLLSPREQRRLILVGLGSVLMALIEVVGVGSMMPFMSVAAQPEIIETNPILNWVYTSIGFKSQTEFLIFLGVGVLVLLVLTNVSQALLHYARTRFTNMRRHSLAMKLFRGYLAQPYAFFLSQNSYEFVKNITAEVSNLINGTLNQFVEFLSKAIQVAALVLFLLIVNPYSTLMVVAIVSLVYGGIYIGIIKTIKRIGKERFKFNTDISRIASEAFWGIKDVKITGTEMVFIDGFNAPSRKLAKNMSTSELLGDIPKFALEAAAFSAIMLFVLLSIIREGSFAKAAATVTLFAYASYRLMPALQAMFKTLTKLKYGAPTVDLMAKEFASITVVEPIPGTSPARLAFNNSLVLKKVQFTYPNNDISLFKDLSLSINANQLIGFAGKTGSGKTTIVDIILGLLQPDAGNILVDGTPVDQSNVRSWQANLGYVPQNIYLSNDSIAANIAFGVPQDKFDQSMIERAAGMAQIHDFIASELKDGYATLIGERGIRLSGGQRQRIGIARALYRNPSLLIMDEATSALDNQTERAVMEAIDALQGTKTIILIAHRLTTLRKCDTIFLMEKGVIIDSGTYQELEQRHAGYFIHT